jgi:hypothetical protein
LEFDPIGGQTCYEDFQSFWNQPGNIGTPGAGTPVLASDATSVSNQNFGLSMPIVPTNGVLTGLGNQLQNTGRLRQQYSDLAGALDPTDKAGRAALKATFQANQTSLGKAMTAKILAEREASGVISMMSNASRTNAAVNAAGYAMKYGGQALIIANIGIETYNISAAAPGQGIYVGAQSSGRLAGGMIGVGLGAEIGLSGGLVGVVIGGAVVGIGGSIAGETFMRKFMNFNSPEKYLP